MSKILTEEELKKLGVSEDLIRTRRILNEAIQSGKCYGRDIHGNTTKCERSFISNPHGYWKLFLRTADGDFLEHGFILMSLTVALKKIAEDIRDLERMIAIEKDNTETIWYLSLEDKLSKKQEKLLIIIEALKDE